MTLSCHLSSTIPVLSLSSGPRFISPQPSLSFFHLSFCPVHLLVLTLPVSVSYPSVFLSVAFLTPPTLLRVCFFLSPSPPPPPNLPQVGSLSSQGNSLNEPSTPNTCQPAPTPSLPLPCVPSAGVTASVSSHHSPLGAAYPQHHSAKHQASGTLPIIRTPLLQSMPNFLPKLMGTSLGKGAGPGCPRPSPQLWAPGIWHCPPGTAGAPRLAQLLRS